jgi:hypothetical protein
MSYDPMAVGGSEQSPAFKKSAMTVLGVGIFMVMIGMMAFRRPAPQAPVKIVRVPSEAPTSRMETSVAPIRASTPRAESSRPAAKGKQMAKKTEPDIDFGPEIKEPIVLSGKKQSSSFPPSLLTPVFEPPFEGVWRINDLAVPMFELKQSKDKISGSYTPADLSSVYQFKEGIAVNNVAQFVVSDALHRVHIKMKLLPGGEAEAESWISPQDAPKMIENYKKAYGHANLTREQAALIRAALAAELKKVGQKTFLGVFKKVSEPK